VLGEIAGGLERSSSREFSWELARKRLGLLTCWPYDQSAAIEYGRLYALLFRIGRPMLQIDIQIAAIAFSLGSTTIVSSDSDLLRIPGLSVENWAAITSR
jgi:tRNA(fMet)-specific endonuclease VapC